MDDSSRLSMVQKDSSSNSKPNGILKSPKELTANKNKETLKTKSVRFVMDEELDTKKSNQPLKNNKRGKE